MVTSQDIPGYQEKIISIAISQIDANDLNPRTRFVDTEQDVLIESILAKGLLNPIIVFKRHKDKRYVILDGERRYRAFKKLKYDKIDCHVLDHEPSDLENLSLMFHIHNVREEWTDFAIAQTLMLVIREMGKDHLILSKKDKLELVEMTSLSVYKINKYLQFYDYPENIVQKFLDSEKREEPIKGMEPDILIEMHAPIKIIESHLPEFLEKYSKEKIIDACVRKKAKEIVKTNRDFRMLSKSLQAMKNGQVRKNVMYEKLEEFIKKVDVTPFQIFEETSQSLYQVQSVIKKSEQLITEIENLDLRQITARERDDIKDMLNRLTRILNTKFK